MSDNEALVEYGPPRVEWAAPMLTDDQVLDISVALARAEGKAEGTRDATMSILAYLRRLYRQRPFYRWLLGEMIDHIEAGRLGEEE